VIVELVPQAVLSRRYAAAAAGALMGAAVMLVLAAVLGV
jgi:hypothetical protein